MKATRRTTYFAGWGSGLAICLAALGAGSPVARGDDLIVDRHAADHLTLAWPDDHSTVLETNDLLGRGWGAFVGTVISTNGTNLVTLDAAAANQFFRLRLLDAAGTGEVTNGLYAWWPMNEGAGTIVHDQSGNGLDAYLFGSPQWTSGPVTNNVLTNALFFSGNNEVMVTPITTGMNCFTNFTVAFWIKAPSLGEYPSGFCSGSNAQAIAQGNGDPLAAIVSKVPHNLGGPGWMIYDDNGADLVGADIGSGVNDYYTGFRPLVRDDGQWHFLVFEFQTTNMVAYLDGALSTAGFDVPLSTPDYITNSLPLAIGGESTNADSLDFTGYLCDVRLWNRWLGTNEIYSCFTNGLVGGF